MPETNYESRCRRLAADPSLRPHGDAGTYNNWGCRCDPCVEAHKTYRAELKNDHIRRDFGAETGGHGTQTRYAQGCKCDKCMDWARAWSRERELAEVL